MLKQISLDISTDTSRHHNDGELTIELTARIDTDELYDLFVNAGGKDYRQELEDAEKEILDLKAQIEDLKSETQTD